MPTAMKTDLHDPGGDEAEAQGREAPLEDGVQRDRGADVGDDQDHLGEGSPQHSGVLAAAEDVVGVVQERWVEGELGGDGGDVGDDEQHSDD